MGLNVFYKLKVWFKFHVKFYYYFILLTMNELDQSNKKLIVWLFRLLKTFVNELKVKGAIFPLFIFIPRIVCGIWTTIFVLLTFYLNLSQ